MEELKLLVDMVKDLPSMALWVIAAFFVYKVTIIGSVYGLTRLGIIKLHSWLTTPKHELVVKDYTTKIDRLVVLGASENLISQLERIAGINTNIETNYIHNADIKWLSEAITEKIEREKEQSR